MNDESFVDTIQQSFRDLVDDSIEFLPKLVVALLLVLVGYVIAKAFSKLVYKAFNYVETHKQTKNLMGKLGVNMVSLSGIAAFFVKWSVFLIFISAAVDVMELEVLTDTFNQLIDFVPNIFAFAVVAGATVIAGNVLKDIVTDSAQKAKVTSARMLGSAVNVAVLIFGLTLAVAQLNLDLTLITNNLTVIVAGIMLALGLAFGLGGREVAGKIVEDIYKNNKNKK